MKISIIIPCYNVEEHIFFCLSSLLKQTFGDWEAILVNDGSKDNTLTLLNGFASKDSRIKVYTQTNQGTAVAREQGIKKAVGEYITFLDADDTLASHALQLVADKLKYDPDIIVSGFNLIKEGRIIKTKRIQFDKLESISYLKGVLCGKYGWELCGKVYKKELFAGLLQAPQRIRIGEDAVVFIQLVARSERIVGCHCPLYNYIQLSQSASHIRSSKYAEETLLAAFFIENYLSQQSFYYQIKTELSAMCLLFYSNSTFKANLGWKHQLVRSLFISHFKLKALWKIPKMKAFYIILLYTTKGRIVNIIKKMLSFRQP